MLDYYKILQVDPSAEPEAIEAAYRRLARKYHTDVNKSADAVSRMKRINAAYETLHDPSKRAKYDEVRRRAARNAATAGRQDTDSRSSSTPPRDVGRKAKAKDLRRVGEWYVFRIGWAEDFWATLNALKSRVPPQFRKWDTRTRYWQVHCSYDYVLAQLFVNFSGARADAEEPPPSPRSDASESQLPGHDSLLNIVILFVVMAAVAYLVLCTLQYRWGGMMPSPTLTATPTRKPPMVVPSRLQTPTGRPTSTRPRTLTSTRTWTTPMPATKSILPPPPCDCSYNRYDCPDFPTQAAAQACFDYCWMVRGFDVHWLDGDGDGIPCEWNP